MPNARFLRILDASINRAGEGLRVIEDYSRFVLDDAFLTSQTKSLRHDLAAAARRVPASDRHAARDTAHDVGTAIRTTSEYTRGTAHDVCAASLKRTEQALRSLEEYGKLVSADFAAQCESLRYRLYTIEKAIDIGRTSGGRLAGITLCVLVDARPTAAEFESLVSTLVAAGVGMIQLREKHLDDRELLARARLLMSLTRSRLFARRQPPAPPGVQPGVAPLNRAALLHASHLPPAEPGAEWAARNPTLAIINDRVDIAALVAADGVHLGQEDVSVKDARAIVGTQMLIGVSTHNIDQARAAVLDGANYLGAGPTFPSQTKAFDQFAGLDYLRQLAAETRLPTFAIGGITATNLAAVLATGISRIAVGGAVTNASDPASAARELLSMLNELPGG